MRLFTGIALAPLVQQNIEALLDDLRRVAPLKWSPPENLHVTTRFIGEWPEARLPELTAALAAMKPMGAIPIEIAGFGYLPTPHRPSIFLAGVRAPESLPALAAATHTALEPLGITREERAYRPHLTLARIKNENIRELREHIAKMNQTDFGSFEATEFHLYLSRPGTRNSVYEKIAAFPLVAQGGEQA